MRKKISDVPRKATRVLNLILAALVLVVIRIWYLAEIQYDDKVEEARKPRQKVVMEPAKRGTIRDRFNIPLAINKIQYQAGVVYADLCQIPRITWEKDESGKRVKCYKRKEYIRQLAELLGKELGLQPDRVDDLIHAKAAFYYQVPFILKEELSEEQYYKLNMLSKDWPGLHVQRSPRRYYPKGKIGADVIGYMGAINREEYDSILQEIKMLRTLVESEEAGEVVVLPEEVESMQTARRRLKDLEEHAYSVSDSIGKAGVESQFEELLRGYHGKKSYYSDARGNFLRQLPGGRPPLSGQRLLLTISSELQEYAEQLLAKNEKIRKTRISSGGSNISDPWIKGGTIIAMDPNNGEVVTLATFPRFDPNDFIANHSEVPHWFETEPYIAEIWDQKRSMEREVFQNGNFVKEEQPLSWDAYLDIILPVDNPVRGMMREVANLRNAIFIQRQVERLLEISGQKNLYRLFNVLYSEEEHIVHGNPPPAHIKALIQENLALNDVEVTKLVRSMDRWFKKLAHNYDKVLLVDLCRVAVPSDQFDDNMLAYIGHQTLSSYREKAGAMVALRSAVCDMMQELFHELYFIPWREKNGAEFLKEKRKEEKEKNSYAKPYIDYYDQKERALFAEFWETYQWRFLTLFLKGRDCVKKTTPFDEHLLKWNEELVQGAHQAISWHQAYKQVALTIAEIPLEQGYAYLRTFRNFSELKRPLYGRYRYLRSEGVEQCEKHLAMAFYPIYGYGNARSYAYRQSVPQGSIFKLVTAFAGLMQKYEQLGSDKATFSNINPFTMVDQASGQKGSQFVGSFIGGKAIPQFYKGGRLMKTMIRNVGEIDIVKALEFSSNPYFSLLAGDYLEDPRQLAYTAEKLSFGRPTGIDLPYEIGGRIPNDIDFNKTGLYSMANGQHTLVVTPLQTCVMLATMANGGAVYKPSLISLTAGSVPRHGEDFLQWKPGERHRESLFALGLNFPLFAKMASPTQKQLIRRWGSEPKAEIEFPSIIQKILFEGMRRVVNRQATRGLGGLSQVYRSDPAAINDLVDLKDEMIGKTSTAESMENLNLDIYRGTNRYNHVWFGGIAFDKAIDSRGFLVRDQKGKPELVVVVMLRYGSFGSEAAPIAAQIIKKWREIKSKHQ